MLMANARNNDQKYGDACKEYAMQRKVGKKYFWILKDEYLNIYQ